MLNPQLVIDETEPEREEAARGPFADDARKVLGDCLETIMKQALSWHEIWNKFESDDRRDAPHDAIRITTGVGKSEQIRREIARFVIEAKRRELPHRVLVLLPTRKLVGEARDKMPDGITTAIWQGRGGTKLGSDEPMCRNPEAVDAALEIGTDVEQVACKRKEARCPFYSDCAYQRQKRPARKADVVFAAHEILFQVPRALGGNFGMVVIDEAFWQDGITSPRLVISSLADELKDSPVRDYFGNADTMQTMQLRELIERLQCAFDRMPDGYVQRAPLIEAGLLPPTRYENSSCANVHKLEWRRQVDHGLWPGASDEKRRDVVKQFGFIGRLPRRAAMWKALDELLADSDHATGRLRIETDITEEGSVRLLQVIGCKDIAKKLAALPLIHADATLPLELVRHYLPNLKLACDLEVEAPHMRITQAIGLPVGKSSLEPKPTGKRKGKQRGAWTETPEEAEARIGRKRQRLANAVRHLVRGRRGLIITYKAIEDDFAQVEGAEVAHFGAIEGIDRWRDVEVVVTIGRPLPRPQDIERLAAAITGKPVIATGAMIWQERQIRPGHAIKCGVYATPEAEMIRQAVSEAAIKQAIGRARGVNRTLANPVEVLVVLSDIVVPGLAVDRVVKFSTLEPDEVDEMAARGLVPQFGADAAKLYPDLFPNGAAARKVFQRCQLDVERGTRRYRNVEQPSEGVTSAYRTIFIRGCHTFLVRYRPQGRGQMPRLALVDPAKIPDVQAVLEVALGKLVLFEMAGQTGKRCDDV